MQNMTYFRIYQAAIHKPFFAFLILSRLRQHTHLKGKKKFNNFFLTERIKILTILFVFWLFKVFIEEASI